jgi:hypothetical protein
LDDDFSSDEDFTQQLLDEFDRQFEQQQRQHPQLYGQQEQLSPSAAAAAVGADANTLRQAWLDGQRLLKGITPECLAGMGPSQLAKVDAILQQLEQQKQQQPYGQQDQSSPVVAAAAASAEGFTGKQVEACLQQLKQQGQQEQPASPAAAEGDASYSWQQEPSPPSAATAAGGAEDILRILAEAGMTQEVAQMGLGGVFTQQQQQGGIEPYEQQQVPVSPPTTATVSSASAGAAADAHVQSIFAAADITQEFLESLRLSQAFPQQQQQQQQQGEVSLSPGANGSAAAVAAAAAAVDGELQRLLADVGCTDAGAAGLGWDMTLQQLQECAQQQQQQQQLGPGFTSLSLQQQQQPQEGKEGGAGSLTGSPSSDTVNAANWANWEASRGFAEASGGYQPLPSPPASGEGEEGFGNSSPGLFDAGGGNAGGWEEGSTVAGSVEVRDDGDAFERMYSAALEAAGVNAEGYERGCDVASLEEGVGAERVRLVAKRHKRVIGRGVAAAAAAAVGPAADWTVEGREDNRGVSGDGQHDSLGVWGSGDSDVDNPGPAAAAAAGVPQRVYLGSQPLR